MKKQKINDKTLDLERYERFCEIIVQLLGLQFATKDKKDVERKLSATSHEFGYSNINDFIDWLGRAHLNHDQITLFAKHFTVGETYFFRDDHIFKLLETKIFPDLIQKRWNNGRYLRIWCAACCTGEEPYSLAMLLDRLIPDIEAWKITILGTDINPFFLLKAEQGIYKKWSFRATPESLIKKYFVQEKEGQFTIVPKIKQMVNFTCLNLIEDKHPSLSNQIHSMDLIICNNVLIYFTKDKINQTIFQLVNSLVDCGYLIVSALEVPYVQNEKLSSHLIDSVTLFRKKDQLHSEAPPIVQPPISKPKKNKTPLLPVLPQVQLVKAKEKEVIFNDLFQAGQYDDLIQKLEIKLQKEENNSLEIMLARTYANQGKTKDAKKWLEKVLQKEKLNPELYFFYSTLLQELDQIPEAINALKKSLFLDQNYVISYYALGNLLLSIGKLEEAERNFRNAIHLLEKMDSNSFLIELGGITVGRLMEIISSIQKQSCSNK